MEKLENVDILKTLEAILRQNTAFNRTNFQYDKEKIWESVVLGAPEEKTLLWLSHPSGTECDHEKDVFLRDTCPHNSWRYYGEQSRDRILAYAVELAGTEGDTIRGNIYPLDYDAHWRRVKDDAIRPDETRITFQSGETHTFPFTEFDKHFGSILVLHGSVKEATHLLRKPERMAEILLPFQQERASAKTVEVGPYIQRLQREKVHQEAARLLGELQKPCQPNSPAGTHFMAEVSPYFLGVANSRDRTRLFNLLPFRSLQLSGLHDRSGIYALISKDEDRSLPLRKPSVRAKLQEKSDRPDTSKFSARAKGQER